MKQEDKELLLKDLCARLPYGLWVEQKLKNCKFSAKCMLNAYNIYLIERGRYDFCKPYLFPMSSMTEEQKKEEYEICKYYLNGYESKLIDFYHKNHLDYRGLISKGLALDATNLNIY